MPSTLQVQQFGRTARVPRRPQHTFNVLARPFAITPIFLAPVLPGETMKNLLFQARVVTDPIKNPLVGWWCEYYFFYVKHRDLNEREQLTNMMIDPSVSAPTAAASVANYNYANGVDWMYMCVRRVTETYFRGADEAPDIAQIGTYYTAQISQMTALDSAIRDADYLAGTSDDITIGADGLVTGQELSQSYILWQTYRANNITNLTYEEYLATYGIPIPQGQDSLHRPELIRYVKEWSYPVNTVDPVTGTPSSAVSWAISERADKDRFFREPGFLFGCCVVRPKVYLKNQSGQVAGALKDALAWLPAVLGDNPEFSVRLFTAGTGPFTSTADYRLDLKDLFLYGDQYQNWGAAPPNTVTIPDGTVFANKKYPSSADADALFKVGTANQVRMDGIVSLNILGMQVDTTPTASPGTF